MPDIRAQVASKARSQLPLMKFPRVQLEGLQNCTRRTKKDWAEDSWLHSIAAWTTGEADRRLSAQLAAQLAEKLPLQM